MFCMRGAFIAVLSLETWKEKLQTILFFFVHHTLKIHLGEKNPRKTKEKSLQRLKIKVL